MSQFYSEQRGAWTGAVLLALIFTVWPAAVSASPSPPFEVILENITGGSVQVEQEDEVKRIGEVLAPATRLNRNAFTASKWGEPGTVTATAVNAIHLLNGHNPETGRGMIFSLLPREFHQRGQSSGGAAIATDIPAGELLFGGVYSPLAGNRVEITRNGRTLGLEEIDAPEVGDRIVIEVREFGSERTRRGRAGRWFREIRFENRFGGLIRLCPTEAAIRRYRLGNPPGDASRPLPRSLQELPLRDELWDDSARCYLAGQVLRPVQGVGRFGGTEFAGIGRVRANHPGVIDVSTSPVGEIGGIQIIPREHAMSPEMGYARTLTQWMVVGPLNALDPSWEGEAPLFSGWLRPVMPAIRSVDHTAQYYLYRYRVEGDFGNGWERMPELTGRDDRALSELEELRILFPVELELD